MYEPGERWRYTPARWCTDWKDDAKPGPVHRTAPTPLGSAAGWHGRRGNEKPVSPMPSGWKRHPARRRSRWGETPSHRHLP